MSLLITVIIGGIVGWLASILMKTNAQMGLLANVIVGIVGSLLGAAIAQSVGIHIHDGPESWAVSIAGAAALIAVLRALGVFSKLPALR
jgi:uncharacterized membrane protein YeaQ/YmgE (transglycosylase-associated protein family)